MTTATREQLFRPEAVAHHARGKGAGRVVGLTDRRAARTFTVLFLLLAVMGALSVILHVDQSATGQAVVRGDRTVVLLPVAVAPRLRPGQRVEVAVGSRTVHTTVTSIGTSLRPDDAHTKYGVRPAGPAVVEAYVALPAGALRDVPAGAVVVLTRRTLAATLLHRT